MNDPSQESVGYMRPPVATRFRKGQSGNPKGRPRNRRHDIPYDHVLSQMVTVREDGRERRITAAEAFILQLTKKGLAGDSASARASLAAIENARAARLGSASDVVYEIIWKSVSPGSVACALDALSMAVKLRKYSEDTRHELKPWIVEAALGRLGTRRLSLEEQRTVLASTRTPEKVCWPDWWTVLPKGPQPYQGSPAHAPAAAGPRTNHIRR